MEVLQAKDLKKIYGSGNNAVHALDGVDLSVQQRGFAGAGCADNCNKFALLYT